MISASQVATYDWLHHEVLVCAHDFLERDQKRFWDLSLTKPDNTDEALIDLKALGCSNPNDAGTIAKFSEVKIVPSVSWISSFGSNLLFAPIFIPALATLILALAAYGVVRAIGWVVGGFAGPH